MALTAPQLNAHLRAMLADELEFVDKTDRQVINFLLRACIRHHRLGGADNQEAAQTVALFVAEEVLGHPPTAAETHNLKHHWVTDADPTAEGEL